MDIVLYITILGFIAGFFFCFLSKMDAMNNKMDAANDRMYTETKDFHGRLCSIEERRKNLKK